MGSTYRWRARGSGYSISKRTEYWLADAAQGCSLHHSGKGCCVRHSRQASAFHSSTISEPRGTPDDLDAPAPRNTAYSLEPAWLIRRTTESSENTLSSPMGSRPSARDLVYVRGRGRVQNHWSKR